MPWMERRQRIGSPEWYGRLERAQLDLRWQEFLEQQERRRK